MESGRIIVRLNDLIQLDRDAVQAYELALQRIDVPLVSERVAAFRDDHRRHVAELETLVRGMGGTPPAPAPDMRGVVTGGLTALRSATGTKGALAAMQANEVPTNRAYEEAVDLDLPPDLRALIERNRDDERRHLAYIGHALASRDW